MGFATVSGFAQAVAEGDLRLSSAISMHLTSNCFPPIHPDFHPGAVKAVEYANAGDWAEEIEFPNGRTFSAAYVIEHLHLGVFVYAEDDQPLEVDLDLDM
jgi:hypothetical protein